MKLRSASQITRLSEERGEKGGSRLILTIQDPYYPRYSISFAEGRAAEHVMAQLQAI